MNHRPRLALGFTVCLQMIGFGIILPILPFYAERFGASALEVGVLAGTFSLAQLVAAPAIGRLGDRIGRRPVMLGSIAGATAAMLLLGLADALWVLFAARLLAGSCSATMAIARAYVAELTPNGQRTGPMAQLGAAAGLGLVVGPMLGGFLSTAQSPALPFFVATGLGLANGLLAAMWLPTSRPISQARPDRTTAPAARGRGVVRGVVRGLVGLLVALNFVLMFGFSGMEATFALLVERRLSWGPSETAAVLVLIGAVVVVTQGFVTARVVVRLGGRSTMFLGMGLLSVGLATLASAAGVVQVVVGAIAIAAGNSLVSPSLHAQVSRAAPIEAVGLALGACTSAASLGRVLGPAAAGLAFHYVDPSAPAWLGAGVVAGGALWLQRATARPPDDTVTSAGRPSR